MIKYAFFMSVLLSVITPVFAQNNSILKELEIPDKHTYAKVISSNNVMVDLVGRDSVIPGYRIRIYFNNSQNTREEIAEVQKTYIEKYPTDRLYVEYKAPYFKITVGNFVNYEEALVKWSRVVVDFKSAFIIQENIPMTALKNPKNIIPETLPADSIFNDNLTKHLIF